MGAKSHTRAEKRKEAKKTIAFASLKNVPTSPRKMRLVANLIRGKQVELALHTLKTSPKQPAVRIHKLLLSAIANWQSKNEGSRIDESDLFIKEILVDSGRILKRIQPAPQGRAHRIKKRSNHVTIILGSLLIPVIEEAEPVEETKPAKSPKAVKEARPSQEAEETKKPRPVKEKKEKKEKKEVQATKTKKDTKTPKETKVKSKNKKD